MIQWLRERWQMLLFVAIAVPLTAVINFWSIIRPNWPYWLACFFVGFVAGTIVIFGVDRVRQFWSGLGKRRRVLLCWLAVPALWAWLIFEFKDQSDRLFDATAITSIVLLLWGAYAVFSRVADRIWLRIHKR